VSAISTKPVKGGEKIDIFAEQHAKERLFARLDESLLAQAKALNTGDGPQLVDVYHLQCLAELHFYLKVVHQFDPAEVEALLQFADPLAAADLCWEESSHEFSFPICDLLEETEAKDRLPLAEPEPSQKRSLREQISAAMQEARQRPPQANKDQSLGGEGR